MKTKFIALAILASAIGFVSCKTVKQAESINVFEKEWNLIELEGEKIEKKASFRVHPYIQFSKTDTLNRISGNGSCNQFFGSFETSDNNELKFSKIGSTRVFCMDEDNTEQHFFKALEKTVSYSIQDSVLTFNDEAQNTVARFEIKPAETTQE